MLILILAVPVIQSDTASNEACLQHKERTCGLVGTSTTRRVVRLKHHLENYTNHTQKKEHRFKWTSQLSVRTWSRNLATSSAHGVRNLDTCILRQRCCEESEWHVRLAQGEQINGGR